MDISSVTVSLSAHSRSHPAMPQLRRTQVTIPAANIIQKGMQGHAVKKEAIYSGTVAAAAASLQQQQGQLGVGGSSSSRGSNNIGTAYKFMEEHLTSYECIISSVIIILLTCMLYTTACVNRCAMLFRGNAATSKHRFERSKRVKRIEYGASF